MYRKFAGSWKALLAATVVSLGMVPAGQAATIVFYDFDEPDPPPPPLFDFQNAPDSTAPNISAGAWSIRDGVFTEILGNPGRAIVGGSWDGAFGLDPAGNRFRFQITVAPGFSLNLNSVSFDDQRFDIAGNTGPSSWSLSINGTSVLSGQSTDPTNNAFGWTSRTVGFGPVTGLTGSFFVDLFASGASGALANVQPWNVDNFRLEGVVVPLPAAVWLLGGALLGLVGISRRRQP
ncbi:MAG: hypothetical protein NFCOHLIN_00230 [Gammaproteobacteria bacterium]|nr:hypothetical protein [Gammaproteobacteria bacterium]